MELGMLFCVSDKVIYIGFYLIDSTMHSGNGVAFTCHAYTYAPFSAKVLMCDARSSAAMHAMQITSEDKNLVIC
jgi:hypothetical protein